MGKPFADTTYKIKIGIVTSIMILLILSVACINEANAAPITFSNLEVTARKDSSVIIQWDTDIPATGQIEHGLNTSYGSLTEVRYASYWHSIQIDGLSEGMEYHYRIRARDMDGNEAISEDHVFTTRTKDELEALVRTARSNGDLPETYYVKTDGDDSKDGLTIETAWQHPSHAADMVETGDTIFLIDDPDNSDDGIWHDEYVMFVNSGIDTHPITMKAYSGTPTLLCTDPKANRDIGIRIGRYEGRSYITIDGITLRRYWKHIAVRRSDNIRILNCSVYTENVKPEGGSTEGISFFDGCHHCLMNNCLIDGDAWNSIVISGQGYGYDGPYWSSEVSSHITVENCTSRNNTIHNLLDFGGITSRINIAGNTLYHGWSGTIYTHQGHPDHLCIHNNTIYDSINGIYFDAGASDSVIESNTIYGIDPVRGHCMHIRAGNTYGDTTFNSSNNIIRNNHCRGDVYYEMFSIGGTDNLLNENDVFSEFGDCEYRFNTGNESGKNGIVRNAKGNKYKVRSANGAEVTVEYTDGRIFSVDGEGEYSTFSFNSASHEIEVVGWVDVGNISGTVTDDATGLPVEGAVVSDGTISDTTDNSGDYTIEHVPVGTYTLTCTKSGYDDSSENNVVVTEDATTAIDFSLIRETIPPVVTLKTITVNGSVDDETVTEIDINGTTVSVTAGAYSHEVDVTSSGTITITAENDDGKTVIRTVTIK